MPVDYQQGKIYKIYNIINDDIYIGSTSRMLCERMRDHRANLKQKDKFKNFVNVKLYKAMEEYGVENFYIELIEKYPCNDIDELRKKEGEYIRELKPSLNIRIAGRTPKEYREDNREYWQEYYENNKEYIKTYKEQYRENNKEAINKQKKQYYENNKEDINSRKGENIACECGCVVTRSCLSRHRQTKKHIKLMNELN